LRFRRKLYLTVQSAPGGWLDMGSDRSDKRPYTARDVKGAAGLSYRQLNDWESKGAVSGDE
jgi:hypothetical protein